MFRHAMQHGIDQGRRKRGAVFLDQLDALINGRMIRHALHKEELVGPEEQGRIRLRVQLLQRLFEVERQVVVKRQTALGDPVDQGRKKSLVGALQGMVPKSTGNCNIGIRFVRQDLKDDGKRPCAGVSGLNFRTRFQ